MHNQSVTSCLIYVLRRRSCQPIFLTNTVNNYQYHLLPNEQHLLSPASSHIFVTFFSSASVNFLHAVIFGLHRKHHQCQQESCAIARYISRSWAVVEIWPFKIIQDGGGLHLEFILIENSAIRSTVPEKPHPITKHEVDRTAGCRDIATWNFSNMAVAAILDLFES